MEWLKMNINICVSFGLFTVSKDGKTKWSAILSNVIVTSNVVYLVGISLAYAFDNVTDVAKVTYSFYVIGAGLIALITNASVIMNRHKFKILLRRLQLILEDRIKKNTSIDYNEHENYIRLFTKGYCLFFFIAAVTSMIMMPAAVAIYDYFNGVYDGFNSWYLPLVTISPYDQNTKVGHIVTHILQTTGIFCLVSYICIVTALYFGVCYYVEAMFLDLEKEKEKIDIKLQKDLDHGNKTTVRREIIDLISFHNTILMFLNDFRELLHAIIFWQFLIGLAWLCSGLFQLKPTLDLMFIQNMSNLSLITSCLYTYCWNGSVVTDKCNDFGGVIYQSLWYRYPTKVQPIIGMVIGRSQVPFYFSGYEFGICSFETFAKLMRMSYSILMVLRTANK